MKNFSSFNLPKQLINTLERLKFIEPTPVQESTIPLALDGKDILGSAQTGTGKTAAFGIPLVARLISNNSGDVLVITPTRELALQVIKFLEELLGKKTFINTCLLIGGESISKQLFKLKRKPRLFVGTPGRINDHLNRKSLKLNNVKTLVLDEMDRMLDMGFSIQIDSIIKHIPKERQTLLFSATIPNNIIKLANSYMDKPERVKIGSVSAPGENISHNAINLKKEEDKYSRFLNELNNRDGSIIVFMKTKYTTEKMSKRLISDGHQSTAIHGDLQHRKRQRVIKAFLDKKHRILVATDIASRGLDIPHVAHVINYDLPQSPEDYLHRIGRTGRAGAQGEAICFISSNEDKKKWSLINRLINPNSSDIRVKNNDLNRHSKPKRKDRNKMNKNSFNMKNKFRSDKTKFSHEKKRRSNKSKTAA